jgi:hypothetical protein
VGCVEEGLRMIEGEVGLTGVAGREWEMYHEKTVKYQLTMRSENRGEGEGPL